ncbi:protein kinase, partial [Helicosporidium sp. ATCC 50920]
MGQRTLEVASSAIKRTHRLRVGVLEGTTFLNQYTVLDTLGRGSFGKVKRCLNTADDELYAVKIVSRRQLKASHRGGSGMGGASSSDALSTLRREIEVMTGLSHPNLVRLVEVIDDVAGGRLLLVMEYAAAGQLVARGTLSPERRMPEVIAQFYFRQMAAGMAHLHAHHVVHGDMKPDNVLLSGDATVKIADFGQARFFDVRDTFRRTRGTPAFLAPEICAGEDYRGRQADMWALGVSLYQFVYGQLPFEADSPAQLYDLIATGDVPYPEAVPVSIELQDFFRRILCPVPDARLTAQDMMQHVWVVGDQWIEALSASLRQGGGEELAEAADPDQVAAVVFPPGREPEAEEDEGREPGAAGPPSPSPVLGRDLDAAVAFCAAENG